LKRAGTAVKVVVKINKILEKERLFAKINKNNKKVKFKKNDE